MDKIKLPGPKEKQQPDSIPKAKQPSKETVLIRVYEGNVNIIIHKSGEIIFPEPPSSVAITDYRLVNTELGIDRVLYPIKDGQWKLSVDEEVSALFQKRVLEARRSKNIERAKRLAIQLMMIFLFLTPAAVLAIRRLRR